MKKVVAILIVMASILIAIAAMAQRVLAGGPCTGEKYEGRPALVQECLHNLVVKQGAGEAYPAPETGDAYPAPETRPTPTARPPVELTPPPMPTPRQLPTEPPEPTGVP